jgi:hypothetical protein
MKPIFKLFIITIMLFSISCEKAGNDPDPKLNNEPPKLNSINTVDIINPILGTVPGTSTLTRNDTGIIVNYNTTGLTPGYAYTLWWVIWNNPQKCAVPGACDEPDFGIPGVVGVDVLYATGLVVGADGIGNFTAELIAGGDYQSVNQLMELPPAGGLKLGNSRTAEVHLALRSHGPVIPGMVTEQISSYIGGCTDPFAFPPFSEIPNEAGECGDIEFAVHSPVIINRDHPEIPEFSDDMH